MQKTVITIVFVICTLFSFGQESNKFNLIALDKTWGKETLRFPSRNMNYTGFGEVRFPPNGWRTPAHDNFWSYTYAWKINSEHTLQEKDLEVDLIKYFNSLNNIDMNATTNKKYSAAKLRRSKIDQATIFYNGIVRIYDRFATNKMIVLNVKIENHYCKKNKKTILLFKFSPKTNTHKTWKMLDKINLFTRECHHQ